MYGDQTKIQQKQGKWFAGIDLELPVHQLLACQHRSQPPDLTLRFGRDASERFEVASYRALRNVALQWQKAFERPA